MIEAASAGDHREMTGRRRARVEQRRATDGAARRIRGALLAPLTQFLFGHLAQLQSTRLAVLAGGDRKRVDVHVDRLVLVPVTDSTPHPVLAAVALFDRADHFE